MHRSFRVRLSPQCDAALYLVWRVECNVSVPCCVCVYECRGSVLFCLDTVLGLAQFAGPGGWNDPDMLEVSKPMEGDKAEITLDLH
jgi:hypothetical protein